MAAPAEGGGGGWAELRGGQQSGAPHGKKLTLQ